eukprot:g57100.t1
MPPSKQACLMADCKAARFRHGYCGTHYSQFYVERNFAEDHVQNPLDEYEFLETLGEGTFGKVSLVRYKVRSGDASDQFFALKELRKEMFTPTQFRRIAVERDVMARTKSKWLVKLRKSFQTEQHLYFLMDFCAGGDLFSLWDTQTDRMERLFNQTEARFYLAELALALHDLHQLGFVHRDLKPQNVLLDEHGHIVLADFGVSLEIEGAPARGDNRRASLVGTIDYVSPETLEGIHSREKADWWALGIIAFHMMLGYLPFTKNGDSDDVVKSSILKHEELRLPGETDDYRYPDSDALASFLRGLLCHQDKRMSFKEIKEHPFFEGFDWRGTRDRNPPFMPALHPIAADHSGKSQAEKSEKPVTPETTSRTPVQTTSRLLEIPGAKQTMVRGFTFDRARQSELRMSVPSPLRLSSPLPFKTQPARRSLPDVGTEKDATEAARTGNQTSLPVQPPRKSAPVSFALDADRLDDIKGLKGQDGAVASLLPSAVSSLLSSRPPGSASPAFSSGPVYVSDAYNPIPDANIAVTEAIELLPQRRYDHESSVSKNSNSRSELEDLPAMPGNESPVSATRSLSANRTTPASEPVPFGATTSTTTTTTSTTTTDAASVGDKKADQINTDDVVVDTIVFPPSNSVTHLSTNTVPFPIVTNTIPFPPSTPTDRSPTGSSSPHAGSSFFVPFHKASSTAQDQNTAATTTPKARPRSESSSGWRFRLFRSETPKQGQKRNTWLGKWVKTGKDNIREIESRRGSNASVASGASGASTPEHPASPVSNKNNTTAEKVSTPKKGSSEKVSTPKKGPKWSLRGRRKISSPGSTGPGNFEQLVVTITEETAENSAAENSKNAEA